MIDEALPFCHAADVYLAAIRRGHQATGGNVSEKRSFDVIEIQPNGNRFDWIYNMLAESPETVASELLDQADKGCLIEVRDRDTGERRRYRLIVERRVEEVRG